MLFSKNKNDHFGLMTFTWNNELISVVTLKNRETTSKDLILNGLENWKKMNADRVDST